MTAGPSLPLSGKSRDKVPQVSTLGKDKMVFFLGRSECGHANRGLQPRCSGAPPRGRSKVWQAVLGRIIKTSSDLGSSDGESSTWRIRACRAGAPSPQVRGGGRAVRPIHEPRSGSASVGWWDSWVDRAGSRGVGAFTSVWRDSLRPMGLGLARPRMIRRTVTVDSV